MTAADPAVGAAVVATVVGAGWTVVVAAAVTVAEGVGAHLRHRPKAMLI